MTALDIAEKIEKTLADVIPLYAQTPEFMGTPPEKYAVYTITERAAEYGEGIDCETEYLCRLSVFTRQLDYSVYKQIKAAMRAAGFGYISGGQTGISYYYEKTGAVPAFPNITHYYLDFLEVMGDE